jgi:hypothetical protein
MSRVVRLRIDSTRTITFVFSTGRCTVKAFRGNSYTPDIKLTVEQGMHLYQAFVNKGALRIL